MVRLAHISSARWQEIESIFQRACDLPPARQEEYLRTRCGDDGELATEVRTLLDAAARDPGFLDWSLPQKAAESQNRREGELVGRNVGNYRVTRFIAAGGMGAVYEAQQQQPRRCVAMKFLRAAWVTPAARKRFEMETQALARMKHPGVAQIYDAGTLDDVMGPLLYFAMEYVPEARTLVEFARERRLTLAQRLDLFAQVCDAVHHGHQRGIIHRDLKPANILVDGVGAPKVIDFGVARLADSDLQLTRTSTAVVGTLAYMSPEQLAGDALDIDTRSDVYSLGVVLYELLCDRLPCVTSDRPLSEVMRAIREDAPTSPSALDPCIDRDLQAVALKALEKDRTRRYQSAAEFAEDIRRFLRHEPVNAQPPAALYQLRMWARRHRPLFVGGCVALLGLALGLAGAVWQAWKATASEARAQKQAQRAEEEAAGAMNLSRSLMSVLRSFDPSEADRYFERQQQVAPSPDAMLDLSAEIIRSQLASHPLAQATLYEQMGVIYANRGRFDRAREVIENALDIRRRQQGERHIDIARTLGAYSWMAHKQGDYPLALTLQEQAYDIALAAGGPDDPKAIQELLNLRNIYLVTGDYAKAEQASRELVAASTRDAKLVLMDAALIGLAEIRRVCGDADEAATLFQKAFDLRRARLGDADPETGSSLYFLAHVQCQRGDDAAIEALMTLALEQDQRTRLLDDNHPYRSGTFLLLGELHMARGELEQAERDLRSCLQRRIAGLPEGHRLIAYAKGLLGECLMRQGKLDEAGPLLQESFDGLRSGYGEHAGWTFDARFRLEQWRKASRSDPATSPPPASAPSS